jgi:hypothetical protein
MFFFLNLFILLTLMLRCYGTGVNCKFKAYYYYIHHLRDTYGMIQYCTRVQYPVQYRHER